MWGSIRTYFFEKETKRRLTGQGSRSAHYRHHHPNHYGLLFDAAQMDHRPIVMQFADKLRHEGNRVKVLGYFEGKSETISLPFDVFTSADRQKLSGIPRSPVVEAFIEQPFDVLVNLSIHHNHKPLEYIATLSKASFRIGPWYHHLEQSPYELCLDTGSAATLNEWINELMHTLEKIY